METGQTSSGIEGTESHLARVLPKTNCFLGHASTLPVLGRGVGVSGIHINTDIECGIKMWHPYPPHKMGGPVPAVTRFASEMPRGRFPRIGRGGAEAQDSRDHKPEASQSSKHSSWGPAQNNGGRREGGPKELGLMAGSVTWTNKRPGRRGLEE